MKIKTLLPVIYSLMFFTNIFAQYGSSLTFSEVMFYPSEVNGEFVEIYNTSTNETVDLTGFKFKYSTSANNNLVSLSGGMLLGPGKYAVILQGNYNYVAGNYKNIIPSDAIILKTSSANFGSSGMANTTDRDVYLINASNEIIDSYTYSANNAAGISDEKILLTKENTSNWNNSLVVNGTPGSKNSASPLDYDLKVKIIKITPQIPVAEDSVMITLVVKNLGQLTADNFTVRLFNDADHDSIGRIYENFFSGTYTNLAKNDSIIIQQKLYIESAKTFWIIANIDYVLDQNKSNNTAYSSFFATERPSNYNDVVINEIMYLPISPEPEWVELYNRSNRNINLRGWQIGDNSSLTTFVSRDIILKPGGYLVISSDSSISQVHEINSDLIIWQMPSLNNTNDAVRIKTSNNFLVDSLRYESSWGGESGGRSLERIIASSSSTDKSNWKTSLSINKATPGKLNSVTPKDNDLVMLSLSSSLKYAVAGKPITILAKIRNNGNKTAYNYFIRLFKDENGDGLTSENEEIGNAIGSAINSGRNCHSNSL
jgi:hypothetical protein